MRVDRISPPPPKPRAAAGRSAAGFATMLESAAGAAAAPAPEEPAPSPETAALAAEIYAAGAQAEAVDQQARRHGRAMLQAMAALQTAMLGGGEAQARAHLARLAAQTTPADDPILRLILREIGLRAAVELARLTT
jgi:hypothetical protein